VRLKVPDWEGIHIYFCESGANDPLCTSVPSVVQPFSASSASPSLLSLR